MYVYKCTTLDVGIVHMQILATPVVSHCNHCNPFPYQTTVVKNWQSVVCVSFKICTGMCSINDVRGGGASTCLLYTSDAADE